MPSCAPQELRALKQIVRDLAKSGTGILLIEQFTEIALSLSDEAVVMSQGKVSFKGTPKLLQEDPGILHEAYLGSMNSSQN